MNINFIKNYFYIFIIFKLLRLIIAYLKKINRYNLILSIKILYFSFDENIEYLF